MTENLIGQIPPEMTLPVTGGKSFRVPADFKGKWTVLYFYPKDDTPGCTRQACNYRDKSEDFANLDAQVIGVSLDDLSSHDQFISKYELNFPLLTDTDAKLSKALGVLGERGLSRDTFLIDPDGKICKVWRKVDPVKTVEETRLAILSAKKTSN